MLDEQRAARGVPRVPPRVLGIVVAVETEEPRSLERAEVPPLAGRRLHRSDADRFAADDRRRAEGGALELGDEVGHRRGRHRAESVEASPPSVHPTCARDAGEVARSGGPVRHYTLRHGRRHRRGPAATAERLATRGRDRRRARGGSVHRGTVAHGRESAVLVLLYDRGGAPHLVLTKRTDTLEHHPGQVSLPGGRPDPDDGDLATTALRETHEELGVAPESVRIVGRLPDVPTTVSGFVISPFVGVSERAAPPGAQRARDRSRAGGADRRAARGRRAPPAVARTSARCATHSTARTSGARRRGSCGCFAAIVRQALGIRRGPDEGIAKDGRAGSSAWPASPASPPTASASRRAIWAVSSA